MNFIEMSLIDWHRNGLSEWKNLFFKVISCTGSPYKKKKLTF